MGRRITTTASAARRITSGPSTPIYGYLFAPPYVEESAFWLYVTHVVQLKSDVLARTTFTLGDVRLLEDAPPGVEPSPVLDPSYRSLLPNVDLREYSSLADLRRGLGYGTALDFEAQVHGGVTVDDIESITVDPPDAEAAPLLRGCAGDNLVGRNTAGPGAASARHRPMMTRATNAPGFADELEMAGGPSKGA